MTIDGNTQLNQSLAFYLTDQTRILRKAIGEDAYVRRVHPAMLHVRTHAKLMAQRDPTNTDIIAAALDLCQGKPEIEVRTLLAAAVELLETGE